jgi:quercetin dioxygenase-like cupin family protein
MDLHDIPFTVTDWRDVPPSEQKGETGTSFWRVFEAGSLRVRMADYSPGFRSDHWCPKGHVFLVLEGEFTVTFKDGRNFTLGAGMSFQAADDPANPHRGSSAKGAKAFIVD